MDPNPVSQILFRTAIAAVNKNDNIRVYTQDVDGGIRESLYYEGSWLGGNSDQIIAHAKIGSPIAGTSNELTNIRIYYISTDNELQEACYNSETGSWFTGSLNEKHYDVAPYSKLAASYLAGDTDKALRLYAQLSNGTIQEFGTSTSGWKPMMNLGEALPGSAISSTSFNVSQINVRVYYQDRASILIEAAYANDKWSWARPSENPIYPPPRAALVAINWVKDGIVHLRVYYAAAGDVLQEQDYDGSKGWTEADLKHPSIPATEGAAIVWDHDNGVNIRVYYENGERVSAVSELSWTGNDWVDGGVISPA